MVVQDELDTQMTVFFEGLEDGDLIRLGFPEMAWLVGDVNSQRFLPCTTNDLYQSKEKSRHLLRMDKHLGDESFIRPATNVIGYFCYRQSRFERDSPKGFTSMRNYLGNRISVSAFDDGRVYNSQAFTEIPIGIISDYQNLRAEFEKIDAGSARRILRRPCLPSMHSPHDASSNLSKKLDWSDPSS